MTTQIDRIEVMDITGHQLTTVRGTVNELSLDLEAAGLSPGVYIYRLETTDGEVVSGRILLME